jgi:hypothetical protein
MFTSLYLVALLSFGSPTYNQPVDPQPEKTYMVIYDIRDLEHVVPDYRDVPDIDLNAALSSQNQSPLRERQQDNQSLRTRNGEEIIRLITSIVEPEVWGVDATIRYYRGSIIVTAPKRIHDQIK